MRLIKWLHPFDFWQTLHFKTTELPLTWAQYKNTAVKNNEIILSYCCVIIIMCNAGTGNGGKAKINTHFFFAQLNLITHNSIIHSPVRISSQFPSVISLNLPGLADAGCSITHVAISAENTHAPAVISLTLRVYVHAMFQRPLLPFRFRLHSHVLPMGGAKLLTSWRTAFKKVYNYFFLSLWFTT